jgi:hypothetical protein
MRYKAKSVAALQLALGSLPDKMRVEVDPDIGVSANTVGELRKVTAWPETLAVTTPQERHADSAVRVSKVSTATRTKNIGRSNYAAEVANAIGSTIATGYSRRTRGSVACDRESRPPIRWRPW